MKTPTPIALVDPGVGATVEWINEFGTIKGSFRGFAGSNESFAVIVSNGSQMMAPANEVFTVEVEKATS